jgi:PAS domain S-box-containing protein
MHLFKLPLMKKFTITCLITITLFGTILGYLLTRFVEINHLGRASVLTSAFIQDQVKTHFDRTDFAGDLDPEGLIAFEKKLEGISFGPGVYGVKVWGPNRQVLWSEDSQQVGKRLENDENLNKAFAGKTITAVADLEKTAPSGDGDPTSALGLYIPIAFEDEASGVAAVFEIHTGLASLQEELSKQKLTLYLANASGVALLFALLTGVVSSGAKTIVRQSKQLENSVARYLNLLRFAHDGIIVINQKQGIVLFNRSAQKIFGVTSEQAREEGMAGLSPRKSRTDLTPIINKLLEGTGDDTGLSVKATFNGIDQKPFETDISLSATGIGEERIATLMIKDPDELPSNIFSKRLDDMIEE